MRAQLLALSLWCLAPAIAAAQPGASGASQQDGSTSGGASDERPPSGPPRKRESDPPRDAASPDVPDWNPLARPAGSLRSLLRERGVRLDVDLAFYGEHVSETIEGDANLGTFAWELAGDWRFLRHEELGKSYLQWTLLGSPGLNYHSDRETLSGNVGSVSGLNANVVPDPAALEEVFLKQVSPGGRLIAMVGRINPSSYFDTNRVANDAYGQFFAFALENNPSIPFPTYGGLGALARFDLREDLYVMAAVTTSVNDEPWAFWQSADDGDWQELLEIGLTRQVPILGEGHYRVTPWHDHVSGRDGFGVGLNFDQELGLDRLVAFFRFGIGDDDVTAIERFASGGLVFEAPFGRKGDAVALGVAWSDPSPGSGARDETLLELYYRVGLSPSISLTPDLQIVLDPAGNLRDDTILIGGMRLHIAF